MIPVALAMIRARAVGAATTFLLATVAIAAAVAAPVYLRAAADSVAEADYATAAPAERLIVADAGVLVRADESDVDAKATVEAHRRRAFDRRVREAMTADGFATHLAAFFPLALAGAPGAFPAERPEQHLEYREDSCRHVEVIDGRCPAAPGEVIVGEVTATRHTLRPGGTVHVQAMMLVPVPQELPQWAPRGTPAELSIVGVYRPVPGNEAYWTGSSSPVGGRSEPVLGDRATLAAVDHEHETQMVVAYPTGANARGLVRADIDRLLSRVRATGSSPVTGLPTLLNRISILAPAAAILAVGVIGAVAFDTVVARWGRRALRRGRLGLALGLLHLGRRRAGARLLALLAVAIGLVGFAAGAADTATQARREQVAMRLGAERVVLVQPVSMRALLHAVRSVDPDGSFAMAVMPLPGLRSPAPVLVVDSPRLARVATPEAGLGAATAALRPAVERSVEVYGDGLVLRAALADAADTSAVLVTAILAPLDGSLPHARTFGRLRDGEHTYRTDVDCPTGCRLENLSISYISHALLGVNANEVTVTLSSLTQTGPDTELAASADLAAWADHHGAPLSLRPDASGLAVSLEPTVADGLVGPADTPDSLAGLAAGQDVVVLGMPAPNRPIAVATVVRSTPALPRLGALGGIVDMEYLARFDEPGVSAPAEVWLAPDAPADAVERLGAAGLTVAGTRERAGELTAAADRPNAVGVRFFLLAGALCLLLAAGGLALAGGIEIEARAEELRSLRAQGLPQRMVGRAGRLSYLIVVGAGTVLGAVAGVVAWIATSDRLPLVDELITGLPRPRWPGPVTLWALGASTVVLGVVAVLLAAALSYRSQRAGPTRGAEQEGSQS